MLYSYNRQHECHYILPNDFILSLHSELGHELLAAPGDLSSVLSVIDIGIQEQDGAVVMVHRKVVHVVVLASSLLSLFIEDHLEVFDIVLFALALLEDIGLQAEGQFEEFLGFVVDDGEFAELGIDVLDLGGEFECQDLGLLEEGVLSASSNKVLRGKLRHFTGSFTGLLKLSLEIQSKLEVLLPELIAVGLNDPIQDHLTGSSKHHEPEYRSDGEFILPLKALEHKTETQFGVIRREEHKLNDIDNQGDIIFLPYILLPELMNDLINIIAQDLLVREFQLLVHEFRVLVLLLT